MYATFVYAYSLPTRESRTRSLAQLDASGHISHTCFTDFGPGTHTPQSNYSFILHELVISYPKSADCRMASSNIKIIREESELAIQFKLDDLDAYFSRSSLANQSRFTDYFGPGLRFGSYSFIENNGPRQLGVYLYTSKEYPSLSIYFSVTAKSLTGELFFTKCMSYTFKSGEAIGWSKFLNLETYQASRVMKEENTLVLEATLKFTPMYPIVSKPTLSVLHHTIVGKDSTDIRFVVYSRRGKIGKLSDPRALFGTQDALAQMGSVYEDSKRYFLLLHY